MTAGVRRRRGLVLLALAVSCGGLAASQVNGRVRDVEARVGPMVPVVVAATDLSPDAELDARAVRAAEVPERYLPPGALGLEAATSGATTAVAVQAGTVLTAAHLQGGGDGASAGSSRLGRGERAVELQVVAGRALAGAVPGARVDVLVSTGDGASGATIVALEDVELLALGGAATDGTGVGGEAGGPSIGATLRVTVRQAVYLTAAQSFGREVRLLVRPPGDRRRNGPIAVEAGDL